MNSINSLIGLFLNKLAVLKGHPEFLSSEFRGPLLATPTYYYRP